MRDRPRPEPRPRRPPGGEKGKKEKVRRGARGRAAPLNTRCLGLDTPRGTRYSTAPSWARYGSEHSYALQNDSATTTAAATAAITTTTNDVFQIFLRKKTCMNFLHLA